jgi:PAS domain S-box-containing protein
VAPPEDRKRLEEQLQWGRQGRSATYEARMLRVDGGSVDVLVAAVPRWRRGEVVGTVAVITDMSKQKATENALRQGEQLVRRFIDQAADAVIIHSIDGSIVDVNQLACESLGYAREDLLRMHVDEIEVAYQSSIHPVLEAQIAAGAPVTLYGVHRRKDGSIFPVEVRVAQVDTGSDCLRVATVRDITERRRREAREQFLTEASRVLALPREYEEVMPLVGQLAAAKLQATTTVDLLDRSGWIVRLAAAASPDEDAAFVRAVAASVPTLAAPLGVGAVIRDGRTAYGVDIDPLAVVGCDASDHVRETLRGRPYAIVPIPGRNDVRGAFTFVRPVDGQAFDAEDVAALEELARLVGLAIDKAESYREVQATKERYRQLFESNPHPMWVVDVETLRFLAVNDAAVEYLGYSREEFGELTVEEVCRPEDLDAHLEFLTRLSDVSRPEELRLKTRAGHVAVMEASAHDIAFEGRPARLALLNDVTERKRLEVELRYAQKLESIGRLASGIAHEINTPVQFIGDSVHFLQEGFGGLLSLVDLYRETLSVAAAGPLDASVLAAVRDAEDTADLEYVRENVPKACERTLAGINRVAEIVRAMREFAHPGPTDQAPADLNRLLGNAFMVARNEYKYVADVETDFGDIPLVLCHAGDLGQAFLNVIVNAAHAIRSVVGESGERGVIRVATKSDGDMTEVVITDSGCGIPLAVRDRIFDPFFTTKAVGEGTGQGLAIARAIVVERHGGTVEFETHEGKGTTFIIRLPVSGGRAG